jgi:uridine kinase
MVVPVPKAVIALAGGTGSGKTTIASRILQAMPEHVAILNHDAYYKDFVHLSFAERSQLNYDHPDSFDNELYVRHVRQLRSGEGVDRPVYNFSTYRRETVTVRVEPRDILLLEGILILEAPEVRSLCDLKIFVDTDADVRILRRITRDIQERGRTLSSVIAQYLDTVKPMHEAFVEPTKRHANVIIPEGAFNQAGFDVILARIWSFVGQPASIKSDSTI